MDLLDAGTTRASWPFLAEAVQALKRDHLSVAVSLVWILSNKFSNNDDDFSEAKLWTERVFLLV